MTEIVFEVTVTRQGTSLGMTIPKEIIKAYGIVKGGKLEVVGADDHFIVRKKPGAAAPEKQKKQK